MLNITPRNIVVTTKYGQLVQKRKEIDTGIKKGIVHYQNVPVQLGPPHTVMFDCFNIMLSHFKLLDIAYRYESTLK
jgi:hypothetical protein